MRIRYEKLFPSCWWEKLLIFHSVFQSFNKCELEWSNTKSSSVLIERDGWDVSTACQLSTSLFMYTCIQALLQVGDLWFSTKNKKKDAKCKKVGQLDNTWRKGGALCHVCVHDKALLSSCNGKVEMCLATSWLYLDNTCLLNLAASLSLTLIWNVIGILNRYRQFN